VIEIIAFILIASGIYFILKGLTEKPEFDERYYDYGRYEEELDERYYERYRPYELKREYDEEDREVKKEVKGGGVILIGPIPIVFGESRYAFYALVLAILLMVISIFFIIAANI